MQRLRIMSGGRNLCPKSENLFEKLLSFKTIRRSKKCAAESDRELFFESIFLNKLVEKTYIN